MSDVVALADAVRAGHRSARDLLEESIARIERDDTQLNAFCLRTFEQAREDAERIDEDVANGRDPGPLAGIPLGVKDLEHCQGLPTTKGSLFYADAAPERADMPHVSRLRRAGAVVIGKVTTAEFGFAGTCDTKLHGTTRNPWNFDRTPGGSSGGSAAAVGAGLVPLCTGGDGGGSIRGPAAFCGVVGMKVSHGRIPRSDGSSENAQYGVLTTTVRDTARCIDIMSGPDDCDRMTLPRSRICYEDAIESLDVEGLRAVWSDDMGFAVVDPEVAEIAREAAFQLVKAAHLRLANQSIHFTNIFPALGRIYTDRLTSLLKFEGFLPDRWNELSDEVRRNFELYPAQERHDLIRAQHDITKLQFEVADFFGKADVMLTPTTACTAFGAADAAPTIIDGRPAQDTQDCPLTPLANFCWHPSISIPAGFTREGLPVGLMITGPRHRDDIVLRLARIVEQARPWPLISSLFNGMEAAS